MKNADQAVSVIQQYDESLALEVKIQMDKINAATEVSGTNKYTKRRSHN